MNRIILIILLVITNTCAAEYPRASGNWVNIEGTSLYINPSTIRKNGSKRTVWVMNGFYTGKGQDADVKSYKTQFEYDCKKETVRSLHETEYSENLGSGYMVFSNNNSSETEPIVPDSIGELMLNFVCLSKA